jgi:hypothetical protein
MLQATHKCPFQVLRPAGQALAITSEAGLAVKSVGCRARWHAGTCVGVSSQGVFLRRSGSTRVDEAQRAAQRLYSEDDQPIPIQVGHGRTIQYRGIARHSQTNCCQFLPHGQVPSPTGRSTLRVGSPTSSSSSKFLSHLEGLAKGEHQGGDHQSSRARCQKSSELLLHR